MDWLVSLALTLAGYFDHAPTGAIGLRWGDAPICRGPRTPDAGFTACDGGSVEALGRPATATILQDAHGFAAVRLRFAPADCSPALQADVARAYRTDYTPGAPASPYTVFAHDEVVHYDACELVVAGPAYGKVYQDALLAEGLRGFVGAVQRN